MVCTIMWMCLMPLKNIYLKIAKMVNTILFIVYHTHTQREQRFWAGKRATISRHKNKGSIECVLLWSIYSDQMSSRSVKRLLLGLRRLLYVEGRNKETILHEMRESVQYKDFWYIMRKKKQVPLDFGNGLSYAVLDYYGLYCISPHSHHSQAEALDSDKMVFWDEAFGWRLGLG